MKKFVRKYGVPLLFLLGSGWVFAQGAGVPGGNSGEKNGIRLIKDSAAIGMGKEALELARSSGNVLEELEAANELAGIYLEFNQFEVAESLLTHAQDLAFGTESARHKAQWFRQNGRLRLEKNEHNLAEYYLLRSIQLFQAGSYPDSLGLSFLYLTENARIRNEYDKGAQYAYRALDQFERLGDSTHAARAREELGYIFQDHGEVEKAMELFEANLSYFQGKQDTAGIASSYGNIAMCHYDLEENELSIRELERSLHLFRTIGDGEGESETLNNIALPYIELGQYGKALDYLEASLDLFKEINDTRQMSIMLYNIGSVKQEQGKIREAQVYYEEAYALDKQHKIPFAAMDYHLNMHGIFADKGDFETALDHFYTFTELRDSMFDERKTRTVKELEFRYDSEKKEQELYESAQELKLANREKQLTLTRAVVAILVLVVLAVVLGFIIYRNRINHRKNLVIAQKEEEITRIKLEAAREKLAENNVKLEEFTRNLLEKNWLISQMEEQIGELKDQNHEEEAAKGRKLEELMKLKILTEEDWQQYKALFTGVYPDFLPMLAEKYSFLTEGEKRFLMLLKLGVTGKEMAGILGVSQGSIRVNRYRIRKKMGLGEEEKLEEVIRGGDSGA